MERITAKPPPIARDRERQFLTSDSEGPFEVIKNETWRTDEAGEYEFDRARSDVVLLSRVENRDRYRAEFLLVF